MYPMQDLVMTQMACDQMADSVREKSNSGHLLWAITVHPFSKAAPLLLEHVSQQALYRALEVTYPGPDDGESPFNWAFAVAEPLGHTCVGTAHALLGILQHDCRARSALVRAGANLATLQQQLEARTTHENHPAPIPKVPKPVLSPKPFPALTDPLRVQESAKIYAVVLDARRKPLVRVEARPPLSLGDCPRRAPAATADQATSNPDRVLLSQWALGNRHDPQSKDFVTTVGFGEGYAVLEAGFVAGPLYGGGTMYLLEQVDGQWQILDLLGGWIS